MPLLDGLRVDRSAIHGYGVIATRGFARGERLLVGDGVLYRDDEEFDDTYALILPGYERLADGSEGPPLYWDLACQSRWINHSCQPNSVVDSLWQPEQRSVLAYWEALQEIRPGDEITYDYAFAAAVAEPCFCRAEGCRGLIVDPDEIDQIAPELRRHLRVSSAA